MPDIHSTSSALYHVTTKTTEVERPGLSKNTAKVIVTLSRLLVLPSVFIDCAVHHGDTVLGYIVLSLTFHFAVKLKDYTILYTAVDSKIKGV